MAETPVSGTNGAPHDLARVQLIVVTLLFFLSGASSLIYQVIWTRQMVFVFGSTTFASATVLSAFMGGLALGSFFAGKWADRLKNPFLIYGLLEGIIGIWAVLAPLMFDAALPLYKIFWQQLHLSVLPFSLVRFIIVSLILLVPTAAMGATLPILSRFITTSLSVVAGRVGTLYAVNTLGAVAGAALGGFVLIPGQGLSMSTMIAAITNILLAVSVYFLSKTSGFQAATLMAEGLPDTSAKADTGLKLSKPALYTMIAFGISGAIAMILEVAWTRCLLLVIGSTTYAFSIMLSTFLIGIFLGSIVAARVADRLRDPVFWFAILQLVLGASGLISVFVFAYLPYLNLCVNNQYLTNPDMGMLMRILLAGLVLVPVTIVLGATFPLAVKSCTLELERVGKSVGTLYSVNTLGAIIGSFAAGFVIIPGLGGEQTLVVCAAANTVLGCVLLATCVEGKMPIKACGGVLAVGFLILAFVQPKIWDLHEITASQKLRRGLNFNARSEIMPYGKWKEIVDKSFEILFWKDGLCANVAIVEFPDKQKSLFTNGHIDASDGLTDLSTQILLPTIPLLLKPQAKDVGDIGWGSGCTMGYALLFPIKNMVCAEIEPAVIETSRFFHKVNLAPENDKRLRIEINDGRNYMLATDEKFDVITSEPSNPWQAGVCNLYTQEYFQICHDRLKPGGVFTMWWQFNEVSADNLSRVFAALKKVYKHLVVFTTYPGDIAACASDEPIKINLKAVQEALEDPKLREHLAYAGIQVPEDLALKVCMTDESVDKVTANVTPNTDDKNHIEFDVARTYEQKNFSIENNKWMLENAGKVWDVIDWGNMTPKEKALKMAGISERAMVQNNPMAALWAVESFKLHPNSFALCVRALIDSQKRGDFESAYNVADYAVKQFPGEVRPILVKGIVELLAGTPARARKDFEKVLAMEPNNIVYKYRLAQTYLPEYRDWYQIANIPMVDDGKADSNPQKVIELLAPALKDNDFLVKNPPAIATLGAALLQVGRTDEGANLLREYLKLRRDDVQAYKLLADAYNKKGDRMGASYCSERATELSKALALKLCQSAEVLRMNGKDLFAVGALRRAINYYPSSPEARIILHKLAENSEHARKFMKELSNFSFEDMQAYKQLESKSKE